MARYHYGLARRAMRGDALGSMLKAETATTEGRYTDALSLYREAIAAYEGMVTTDYTAGRIAVCRKSIAYLESKVAA